MRRRLGVMLGVAALAGAVALVSSDTSVDQGKPGTQGSWPVAVVSGLSPDGGLGALIGVQGVGVDGGVPWNFTSTTIRGSGRWRLQREYNLLAFFLADGGTTTSTRVVVGFLDGGWGAERISATAPNYRGISMDDYPAPVMVSLLHSNSTSPTVYVRSYTDPMLAQIEATAGQLAFSNITLSSGGTGSAQYAEGSFSSPGFQPSRIDTFYSSSKFNVRAHRSPFMTIEVTGNWTAADTIFVVQFYTFE